MSRILIRDGRVLNPATNQDEVADLLIEAGKIVAIERGIAKDAKKEDRVIDAKGCWVTPGLVDIHVHLRDPGFEYKENIFTGTKAAARGGFTAVACMANTNPVNDNSAITEYILNKARDAGFARVFPIGAVSRGLEGQRLSDFGDLRDAGCVALSDDGKPVTNTRLFRHALEYARNYDLVVTSHCEDPFLFCGGHMNEGLVSTEMGIQGIPNACEEVMVARDIELAALSKGRLHLAHLSGSGSVRFLRQAKDRGLRVTGEVTPHHLWLTEEAVRGYNADAKMNPPLRTELDRGELMKGLQDRTFDAIASDHAPHSQDEKGVEFEKAPFGIVGLETTLPLTLKLVHEGFLKPLRAIELLTTGPAKALSLPVGFLKKGGPADVTIIDPDVPMTVERSQLVSRSRNTPFEGWKLKGRARMTILNGEIVYDAIEKSENQTR